MMGLLSAPLQCGNRIPCGIQHLLELCSHSPSLPCFGLAHSFSLSHITPHSAVDRLTVCFDSTEQEMRTTVNSESVVVRRCSNACYMHRPTSDWTARTGTRSSYCLGGVSSASVFEAVWLSLGVQRVSHLTAHPIRFGQHWQRHPARILPGPKTVEECRCLRNSSRP